MEYPVVPIHGKLFLHSPQTENELERLYRKVFSEAVELTVVSAYLTNWDSTLKLNSRCNSFRVIVGKDFGITKKAACTNLLEWMPPRFKSEFWWRAVLTASIPRLSSGKNKVVGPTR